MSFFRLAIRDTRRDLAPLYALMVVACFFKWASGTGNRGDPMVELFLWIGVVPLVMIAVPALPLLLGRWGVRCLA